MRLLIFVLTTISFNAWGLGLQDYAKYKNNNGLLESDVARLEEIVESDKGQIYKETLDQYKYLLAKYDIVNSRLSLSKFSEDAGSSGWSNIKRIARNLSTLCEEGRVDHVACKQGIERLKDFVIQSSLDGSSKESIYSFLNDYLIEANVMATFDEFFVIKFNQNSEAVNARKFNPKVSPAIVVNVKPITDQVKSVQASVTVLDESNKVLPPVKPRFSLGEFAITVEELIFGYISGLVGSISSTTVKDLIFFTGSLGLFLLVVVVVHLNSKRRKIKSFQTKILKIAKTNKMKVKIFGRSDFSGVKKVSLVEKRLLDSFLLSRLVGDTAHMKFKVKNNILSIETLYFSKRSIQNFLDKESAVFQQSLETLKQTVEFSGGELSFINKFNSKGEITQTSYVISLPRD